MNMLLHGVKDSEFDIYPADGKYAPQIPKLAFSIEIPLKKIQKDS